MSKRLLNLCLTAMLSIVCTAAWALSEVDGVYKIGSAADWEELKSSITRYSLFQINESLSKMIEIDAKEFYKKQFEFEDL